MDSSLHKPDFDCVVATRRRTRRATAIFSWSIAAIREHERLWRRNRAWGERTGRSATPPADNLVLEAGGSSSLEDLVAGTERGLLLTCLWYIREVDPERLLLTGLTRDGVYLIEDGQVSGAVNNFRFNESPLELLGRITEVGRTERVLCREWNDWVNRTAMPPITVADFNMSTVSQAS